MMKSGEISNCKILGLSAGDENDDSILMIEAGADGFLSKPITYIKLITTF